MCGGHSYRPGTQLKAAFVGQEEHLGEGEALGYPTNAAEWPSRSAASSRKGCKQCCCQEPLTSTWMLYHVLNIKMNQHRRPQSKTKLSPVHSTIHSPTHCGQPQLRGYSSRLWGFNHPLSKLVVSPAKMKTCVYCFFFYFGQTINIYAMHYQTKNNYVFCSWNNGVFFLVGLKLRQGGIEADASSVQGQST